MEQVLVLHGQADRLENNTAMTWGLSDSLTWVTQLLYILCLLFLISLPLPKATLRTKGMVLRIFSIALYLICNKWLCVYWIPQLQTTFSHSKQQFIAPHSLTMNIRFQLMPLESTNIATKRYLKRKCWCRHHASVTICFLYILKTLYGTWPFKQKFIPLCAKSDWFLQPHFLF